MKTVNVTVQKAVSSFNGTTRSPPLNVPQTISEGRFSFLGFSEDLGNRRHILEKYVHGPNSYELECAAT